MSIVIPPELQQFVDQQVASGQYPSPDEVVVDGLRVLREFKEREADFRR